MMDRWDAGHGSMMGATGGWAFLLWLVVFVDLVLLGMWLWKQLQKKQTIYRLVSDPKKTTTLLLFIQARIIIRIMKKPSPVVHFEMGYKDRARMVKFYEKVFGWKTQQMGAEMGNYVVAQTAETDKNGMVRTKGAINGGFYEKTDDPLSQAPSVIVSVQDIQAAIKAVKNSGGKILGSRNEKGKHTLKPQMIPGVGLWISVMDTEGNRVSILQAGA